jgi:nucleotide sugar dehydrogenase
LSTLGIIGNGFVGSAVASGFSLAAEVKIYDTDARKSSHSFEEVVNCDFVFVCVPTPMSLQKRSIDLSIMDNVFENMSLLNKRDDNIFIIKSTVTPGSVEKYTEKYKNLNIVHSPEFLTERSARLDFINSSRIVLGGAPKNTGKVKDFFRTRFPTTKIIETDVTTAQFIKYMNNTFFAVKVSFMNELKQAADIFGVDWAAAMDGFMSDGRVGNSHVDVPGHDGSPGFGGKCFPKDLNAFIECFKKAGIDPKLMIAAWEKNLEVRRHHDWKKIDGATSE